MATYDNNKQMNYQNGKIYKIESHLGDKIYIGSTTKQYLSQRMVYHRYDYIKWKNNKIGNVRAYDLFDEYGIDNCSIALIEMCPCNTRDELRAKEGHYIKTMACVNKNIAGRSVQEYNEAHKEERKHAMKEFHEKNPNYCKDYFEAHKEHYKELRKVNYEKHKNDVNNRCECQCGGRYITRHKRTHDKSIRHRQYLDAQNA